MTILTNNPNIQTKEYKKDRKSYRGQFLKQKAFEKLGGAYCVKCKITDVRILTINHKSGKRKTKGSEKVDEGGKRLYRNILNGDEDLNNIEVRCYNCNILYEYERGRRKEINHNYKYKISPNWGLSQAVIQKALGTEDEDDE